VVPVAPAEQAELEKLVRRIVKARGESDDVTALEAEVNERVYRLFGLTREEIALIEESK
jgi:adenine-specific DNA-methyltransferase